MKNCDHLEIEDRENDWDAIGETITCPNCDMEFVVRFNKWDDSIYYIKKSILKELE